MFVCHPLSIWVEGLKRFVQGLLEGFQGGSWGLWRFQNLAVFAAARVAGCRAVLFRSYGLWVQFRVLREHAPRVPPPHVQITSCSEL